MTTFVMGPGGTLIPENQYLEMTNEDGSDPKKDEKISSSYSQLTTREKITTKDFMKRHPELTTSEGRANHFRELAATELLRLREENENRQKEGKPLLTEHEKNIFVSAPGVIKSVWRAQEEEKINRDAANSNASNLIEIAGLGQDKDYLY